MNNQQLIDQLTLEEKVGLMSGSGWWMNHAPERSNLSSIRPLKCTHGPNGARGSLPADNPKVTADIRRRASFELLPLEDDGAVVGGGTVTFIPPWAVTVRRACGYAKWPQSPRRFRYDDNVCIDCVV